LKNWIDIFIDGSSLGKYGYYIPSTKQKVIVRESCLSNNQAEYLALLQLVMDLDRGSMVKVYTDSQLLYHQLRDEWQTKDLELVRLKNLINAIIKEKELEVDLQWVNRERNMFGKMLDREKEQAKRRIKNYIESVEYGS